jgi:hypothetical protein
MAERRDSVASSIIERQYGRPSSKTMQNNISSKGSSFARSQSREMPQKTQNSKTRNHKENIPSVQTTDIGVLANQRNKGLLLPTSPGSSSMRKSYNNNGRGMKFHQGPVQTGT